MNDRRQRDRPSRDLPADRGEEGRPLEVGNDQGDALIL
jgi:hypothetical protein